jgi:hypothetical protein
MIALRSTRRSGVHLSNFPTGMPKENLFGEHQENAVPTAALNQLIGEAQDPQPDTRGQK